MPDESIASLRYVRNEILRRLRSRDLERLLPRVQSCRLDFQKLLQRATETIDHVYFVETGTVSMIATLADGTEAEVGLVGREGVVGLPLLLGSPTANLEALVQVDGTALKIPNQAFRQTLVDIPALRDEMLRYLNVFHLQVAQTAACNSCHPIEKRLVRWILMTADRCENNEFPMTQEFMSRMLGVRRSGVNVALGRLQRIGLVHHEQS